MSYAILTKRHNHGVDNSWYNLLLDLDPPYGARGGPFSPHRSFLRLYRPSSPSSFQLYTTLKNHKFLNDFLSWKATGGKRLQKILLVSILDGAELALNEAAQERARFCLDFAEEHFPTFISPSPAKDVASRIERAREEVEAFSFQQMALGNT